jgi:hypothetical protein
MKEKPRARRKVVPDLLNPLSVYENPGKEIGKGVLHLFLGLALLGISVELNNTLGFCSVGEIAAIGLLVSGFVHGTAGFKSL